jgi:hypothetical protein
MNSGLAAADFIFSRLAAAFFLFVLVLFCFLVAFAPHIVAGGRFRFERSVTAKLPSLGNGRCNGLSVTKNVNRVKCLLGSTLESCSYEIVLLSKTVHTRFCFSNSTFLKNEMPILCAQGLESWFQVGVVLLDKEQFAKLKHRGNNLLRRKTKR